MAGVEVYVRGLFFSYCRSRSMYVVPCSAFVGGGRCSMQTVGGPLVAGQEPRLAGLVEVMEE